MWKAKPLALLISILLLCGFSEVAFPAAAQTQWGLVSAIAWNSDGTRLAIGNLTSPFEVVDLQTHAVLLTDSSFRFVNSLDWSPNNPAYLAIGGDMGFGSGKVAVLDTDSGEVLHLWDANAAARSAVWSPDGSKIAAASNGIGALDRYEVRVWDAISGDLLTSKPYSTQTISSIAWSPDGSEIAGDVANAIQIWNATSGDVVRTLRGHDPQAVVESVAWSPDGSKLASTGTDGTLRVWNAYTGKLIAWFPSNFGVVKWSPDSKQLAVGEPQALRVLDAASGQALMSFTTNELDHAFAYSPNGERLAFGGGKPPHIQAATPIGSIPIQENLADGSVHIIWLPSS
jgi:WD40 repeat protein